MSVTPDEMHRRIHELLKVGLVHAQEPAHPSDKEATPPVSESPKKFQFPYTPKEVKAYLDRFVIKQDEAKKTLAVAVCDHYHHLAAEEKGEALPSYLKQNILLIGPTGVGKTYLVKSLAALIGVPFVKADATKFTETGYVGGDVEDLVRDLLQKANGDKALAQCGIIYIDEIDKISTPSTVIGRDVSGRGVQTNLLKLMEESEVSLRAQQDMVSQLQSVMEFQRSGKTKKETLNTRNILFIVSGAFDKLDEIIRKRLDHSSIGFASSLRERLNETYLLSQVSTADLVHFGFEPEFVGRLPVRVACEPLEPDDFVQILSQSEGSILHQYRTAFQAYGIDIEFTSDGLSALATLAAQEKTGARGLMTVCERTLRSFKYELPGTGCHQLVVDQKLVDHPAIVLKRHLEELQTRHESEAVQFIYSFAREFQETHGLELVFEPDAAHWLAERTGSNPDRVREHFKDFEFGLKLIQKNSGQSRFVIHRSAAENPDKILSEWVVASYQASASRPEEA